MSANTRGNNNHHVFQQFYCKLLEILPLDDVIFVAKLYSERLLPGNLKSQIKSEKTSADKAALFLDSAIEPSVTSDGGSSFDKLLHVMEDSEYQHVKELAEEIRTSLKKRSGSYNALHSTTTLSTSESAKPVSVVHPRVIDVKRLKSRYLRQLPTAKTGWPKHKVTEFVRLALIQKEGVTLQDENLNEITKLTLQGDVDRILKKKTPLANLRDIFHYENKPCPRLIVIMGGPGIGKTTLANEVCLRWARDGFLSDDFDAVALIPMRCVQQRSLKEVVVEYLRREVYEQVESIAGSRCLIILEGLDEMERKRQKSDPFFIGLVKECTLLEEATVMITSRPHACDKLNADRCVEVIGFGESEIEEFIIKSFPDDEHSVSKLLKQLNDFPHLKSLSYVPLNLLMLVDIFQCQQNKELPSTLTELYKLFIVMILQREMVKDDKECSSVSSTTANSENLKKMLPGIPINAIGTVVLLCRLSFCGFFDWHVTTHYVSQLKMRCCVMGDNGAEMLVKHYYSKKVSDPLLKLLDVHDNSLTVVGMDHMMKIVMKSTTTLRELHVSYNNIGDNGVLVITEWLVSNKTLTKLDVSRCNLSVKGAIFISQALIGNQTLLELHMWNNIIGDDGIAAIAGSLSNSSITLLNVLLCGISVVGARLIMKSAVENGVCNYVQIDSDYYKDDEVKMMMSTLDERSRQNELLQRRAANSDNKRHCHIS